MSIAAWDSVFERLDYPKCLGHDYDDFLDDLAGDRVRAFKLDGVPANNVCGIYDTREDNNDD